MYRRNFYSTTGSAVAWILGCETTDTVELSIRETLDTEKGSEIAQSCLTLCNPTDCSLPSFSIHGIFQARILKWVVISLSRGSSWPRDWTWVSSIAGRCFTVWASRKGWLYMHMINTLELCVYQLFVFDKSLLFNIIWEIFSMACLFIYQIYLSKNKSH